MSKTKKTGSVKLNLDADPKDEGQESPTPEIENPSENQTENQAETQAQDEPENEKKPDNEVSTDTSRGGRYISLGGGQYKRVASESTNE